MVIPSVMGLLGSRICRVIAGLVLVGGPANAQLPIAQSNAAHEAAKGDKSAAAHPANSTVEAARQRAQAGDLIEARELYRRLLRDAREESAVAESAADRAVATRETLKAELAAVEDRFAYVSVLVQGSAGADTRVTCDGQALPPGSLGVPLSLLPGKHEFQAFGPGVESSKVALNLTPRAVEMVSLTLTDPNAAAPIPAT